MRFMVRFKLAAMTAVAALFVFSDSAQASLIGSNVNVGFYVTGDYIDANYGSTGTDPNALFLDPDGDPLRNLTVADGSFLNFSTHTSAPT